MPEALIHVCGLVAYDGTDYHGFQLQPGVPTIQGTLEAAVETVTGAPVRVIGSGRTDSGVHARGQVIAMWVPWRHAVENLQRALNAKLPASIAVRQFRLAPPGFHPRFSAIDRTYCYTVYDWSGIEDRSWPRYSPLTDRFALYVPQLLDLPAMQAAVDELIGIHDFATFGQPTQGESTVRHLYRATWQVVTTTVAAENAVGVVATNRYIGRCLLFTVCANGFLRQMVRNLVGVSLAVGRGNWSVEDVKRILAARDRSQCTPPAPANGLVLESVSYPADFNLVERITLG
jgi:tRNA pseudouridine38-40 synthase